MAEGNLFNFASFCYDYENMCTIYDLQNDSWLDCASIEF